MNGSKRCRPTCSMGKKDLESSDRLIQESIQVDESTSQIERVKEVKERPNRPDRPDGPDGGEEDPTLPTVKKSIQDMSVLKQNRRCRFSESAGVLDSPTPACP